MPSSSNKPLVFISYAHLGEPNPPEEPRWLSFVMEFLRRGVKGRKYEVDGPADAGRWPSSQ
jgi:hypothetical protein